MKDLDAYAKGSFMSRPRGCYLKAQNKCQLVFNKKGLEFPMDPDRPVLCRVTANKKLYFSTQWETIVHPAAMVPGSIGTTIQIGLEPEMEPNKEVGHIDVSWGLDPNAAQAKGMLLIDVFNPFGQIVSHFHLTGWEIFEKAEEGLIVMPDGTMNGYYILDLENVQLEIKIIFRNFNFNRIDSPQLIATIRPRRFFPMIESDYFDLGPYEHPGPFLQNPNPKPTAKNRIPGWMFFVLLGLILSLCATGYCLNQRSKRQMGTDYYSIILDEQINRQSDFSSREVGLEV